MRLIGLLGLLAACLPDEPGPSGGPRDRELDPTAWCEAVTEARCGFDLRCGRAVGTLEDCVAVAGAACEADVEPILAFLVDGGQLTVSEAEVEVCAAAFAEAGCEQPEDVVGAVCAGALAGGVGAGGRCGPGVSGAVCEEGDRCLYGADGCGVCTATIAADQPCTPADACEVGTTCYDDPTTEAPDPRCLPPSFGGERCDDRYPCTEGLFCFAGSCYGPDWRQIGEDCEIPWDLCVEGAVCHLGTCLAAGNLGDPCSAEAPCGAGACIDGVCALRLPSGATCERSAVCESGACQDGRCASLPGVCFL
jgi:hypothetical protein